MDVWDAIVVGARVAGSLTALHLARRGHRVLVLDRATFPSDTLSTHNFGRETMYRLAQLDLEDEIAAGGAPPLRRLRMAAPDDGVEFTGRYLPMLGVDHGYCLRRIKLDDILARAARAAGAEMRESTTVAGLLWDEGQVGGVVARDGSGRTYPAFGQVVIGADGRHSRVARWVRAEAYLHHPPCTPVYYAYFRGVTGPRDTVEVLHTSRRHYLLFPTDEDLTCVLVALPQEEVGSYRTAHERSYLADLATVPALAERFTCAERIGPVRGAADLESYVRVPAGPGWLLVGDAAVHVHPITARGISLAVRDAELLAEALAAALEGRRPPGEALAEYHQLRDAESVPAYQQALTAARMTGRPLPRETLELWAALACRPDEADRWVSRPEAGPTGDMWGVPLG
jgi:flavin-dependent dehydrogenase